MEFFEMKNSFILLIQIYYLHLKLWRQDILYDSVAVNQFWLTDTFYTHWKHFIFPEDFPVFLGAINLPQMG